MNMESHTTKNPNFTVHHATATTVWAYWPIAGIYILSAIAAVYSIQWNA